MEGLIKNQAHNELTKYQVISFGSRFSQTEDSNLGSENYNVEVRYTKDEKIPDGLRKMVNQAVLGLNSTGFDDFTINPEIQKPKSNNKIGTMQSVFSNWILSFGSSKIQTIPSQEIGIVASKRAYGNRVANLNEDGSGEYEFINVDSTANFPYIQEAKAKTLEIAGLKTYYELVE